MQISATSVLAPTLATAPPPPTPAAPVAATLAGDTVTLSPEALAALNAAAAPSPAADTWTDVWTDPAVTQAFAALNDVSGQTAVADQLDAFKLINGFVIDPGNFDTNAERAHGTAVTAAFLTSPYALHLQDVYDGFSARLQLTAGGPTLASVESALTAFDALSADDQQTYVGALNIVHAQTHGGQESFASVEAYRANQQAQISFQRQFLTTFADPAYDNLQRENPRVGKGDWRDKVDAITTLAQAAGDPATVELMAMATTDANTDAWTARVQAYFAANGPPPATAQSQSPTDQPWRRKLEAGYARPDAQALAKALTSVNDATGQTPIQAQLDAYNLLQDYALRGGIKGPAGQALLLNQQNSSFAKRVNDAASAADDWLPSLTDTAAQISKTALGRLNGLSREDQQIVFDQHARAPDTPFRFASLDGYKANITVRGLVGTLLEKVLEHYGVRELKDIKDLSITNTPRFKALMALFSRTEQLTDDWTREAQATMALWRKP